MVYSISFQTFLVQTLENSVCYCYTYYEMADQFLWFQVQINNYSSNWNTPYSWISKIQSGRQDTLKERYAIKFCFKLGKDATETYGMLQTAFRPSCMNRTSVFEWHKRFKEGRESVRDDEMCGRSKEVRTLELIGQSVRVGLLFWGFKGVQEEIPSEEASTLQIGSVAFPPRQYTSPQLHACHRLFDQDRHQESSSPSL